ncbi:hypothetical protein PQG02_36150 (plasmid) [Nostoc sp. UHCC 0926]|uniref:hypothetical protein n=1 Tax=Nostoc sp. UHCC 0926 TaxID=3025190 RepID=UPI00235F7125|nr:hypothetical protein [Nostoc sp. UHCC 0926]WDD36566.1 hypothetical protein PQG02_36150 [Nostoc sp. UHCC 0926]
MSLTLAAKNAIIVVIGAIAEAKSLNLALPDAIVDVILGNIGHNSSDKNFLLITSASPLALLS